MRLAAVMGEGCAQDRDALGQSVVRLRGDVALHPALHDLGRYESRSNADAA